MSGIKFADEKTRDKVISSIKSKKQDLLSKPMGQKLFKKLKERFNFSVE